MGEVNETQVREDRWSNQEAQLRQQSLLNPALRGQVCLNGSTSG